MRFTSLHDVVWASNGLTFKKHTHTERANLKSFKMGAKGSVEAAKMNTDNWGPFEVCLQPKKPSRWTLSTKPLSLSHKITQPEKKNTQFRLIRTSHEMQPQKGDKILSKTNNSGTPHRKKTPTQPPSPPTSL